MLFLSCLRTLRTVLTRSVAEGKPTRASRRQPAPGFRPRLEVLEDRLAPATFTIIPSNDPNEAVNNGRALWDVVVAANALPEAEDVTIFLRAGIYTSDTDNHLDWPFFVPAITHDLKIIGDGSTLTVFDGRSNGSSALEILNSNVSISGVTIKDAGGGAPSNLNGGGIHNNHGTLTLTDCTLSGNRAFYAIGLGGGIYNDAGTLTIDHSTLSGNSANSNGGAIYNLGGTVDVKDNSTLSGNTASSGAGIYNDGGTVTISDSTLSGNSARIGGGVDNRGTLTVTNSTLSGNSASVVGGGIDNPGTMTISNSTFSYNTALVGGGIDNDGTMVLTSSLVTNNTADSGGGIDDDGPATITDTVISHNHAIGAHGGGIWTYGVVVTISSCDVSFNDAAEDGGGIENGGDGVLVVKNNTTVSDNTTEGSGGGIGNDGATVTISDSTVSNNHAPAGNGGAIATYGGSLTLENCNVTLNDAYQNGGGMFIDPAVVTIIASTFSGNTAPVGADLYNLDSSVLLIGSNIAGIYNSGGAVSDPIGDLLAQVAGLNLSSGQTSSLTSTLQAAQRSLTNANATAGVNQLNAFINQLNALVRSRRLGEITADSLVNDVGDLINVIL